MQANFTRLLYPNFRIANHAGVTRFINGASLREGSVRPPGCVRVPQAFGIVVFWGNSPVVRGALLFVIWGCILLPGVRGRSPLSAFARRQCGTRRRAIHRGIAEEVQNV